MRRGSLVVLAILLAVLGRLAADAVAVGVGHKAKTLCSGVFVSARDPGPCSPSYARLFGREPSLVDDRFSGFDLGGVLFGLLGAAHFGEAVDTRRLIWLR